MTRTAKVSALAAAGMAFLLVTVYLSSPVEGQVSGSGKPMAMVLEGNFRVYYDCAFIDKTKKKDQEEQVNRIEFHPEYIVLFGQTGSGRVIPVHAIKELTWEQS